MATVRITSNIRYQVKEKIAAMYAKRIREAIEAITQIPGVCSDIYMRETTPEERKYAAVLGKKWISSPQEMFVTIRHPNITSGSQAHRFRWRPPSPTPQEWGSLPQHQLLPTDATYSAVVEAILNAQRIQEECNSLLKDIVGNILTNCSTLKQVLELWPQALEFMPEHVVSQHNKTPEKREKLDLSTIKIDDQTKANMLKARMLCED